MTNAERARRAGAAFLASEYALQNNDPVTFEAKQAAELFAQYIAGGESPFHEDYGLPVATDADVDEGPVGWGGYEGPFVSAVEVDYA